MSEQRDDETPKKPYAAPRLTVHGDLRTLTRMKGGIASDAFGSAKTKAGAKG